MTVPDGSIYVEFDRGVLYVNENGTWQYIAGTYALLNPDQRPTDLGQTTPASSPLDRYRSELRPAPIPVVSIGTDRDDMVLYGTHARGLQRTRRRLREPSTSRTTGARSINTRPASGSISPDDVGHS